MVHQRFMWPFSFSNARWGEYCDRADKKHSKICFFFLPKGRTQFNLVTILQVLQFSNRIFIPCGTSEDDNAHNTYLDKLKVNFF